MSRIGLKPVVIPSGVEVTLGNKDIIVKKGELCQSVAQNRLVVVERNGDELLVKPSGESKRSYQMWGTMRALLNNAVIGVSEGFEKKLDIFGVGYRVLIQGKSLVFSLGYSHDVKVAVPDGLEVVEGDKKGVSFVVRGVSKEQVGQFASNMKKLRKTDVYKGKGIRYRDERVILKEGKKK